MTELLTSDIFLLAVLGGGALLCGCLAVLDINRNKDPRNWRK